MLILKREIPFEFQSKTNVEVIVFLLMHFWFPLDLSDINLGDIDLLDTDLYLLDTYISSKHSVCLQGVFKSYFQDVFKTYSQDVLNTYLQEVFKTCFQDMFSRRLQDIFRVTIYLPRHLEDSCSLKEVLRDFLKEYEKLLCWRHAEDVFKTCLEDQRLFAGKVLNQKIKTCHKVLIKGFSHKVFRWSLKNNYWVWNEL